jgi:hypothetical protein
MPGLGGAINKMAGYAGSSKASRFKAWLKAKKESKLKQKAGQRSFTPKQKAAKAKSTSTAKKTAASGKQTFLSGVKRG